MILPGRLTPQGGLYQCTGSAFSLFSERWPRGGPGFVLTGSCIKNALRNSLLRKALISRGDWI